MQRLGTGLQGSSGGKYVIDQEQVRAVWTATGRAIRLCQQLRGDVAVLDFEGAGDIFPFVLGINFGLRAGVAFAAEQVGIDG